MEYIDRPGILFALCVLWHISSFSSVCYNWHNEHHFFTFRILLWNAYNEPAMDNRLYKTIPFILFCMATTFELHTCYYHLQPLVQNYFADVTLFTQEWNVWNIQQLICPQLHNRKSWCMYKTRTCHVHGGRHSWVQKKKGITHSVHQIT